MVESNKKDNVNTGEEMFKIQCPECGKEVVSNADNLCPNCGYPFENNNAEFETIHYNANSETVCKFSEIINLKPVVGLNKNNSAVFEVCCGFASEYVLGVLGYTKDDPIYYTIKDYYLETTISSNDMLASFEKIPELAFLLSLFPKDKKDFDTWEKVTSNIVWKSYQEKNILCFNDRIIETPKIFLSLAKNNEEEYLAQKYLYIKREYVFSSIGDGMVITNNYHPFIFNTPKIETTFTKTLLLTQEEFFASNEDVKLADSDQRKAIISDIDKDLLVLAGAGSGKTRTLVCRLAYLHLVKGISLDEIVLLTFTNAAAMEMRKRAEEIISPIYKQNRPNVRPMVNARTIDSFLKYVIESFWVNIGFDSRPVLYLNDDDTTRNLKLQVLDEIITDNNLKDVFSYYYDLETGMPNNYFYRLLRSLENYAVGSVENISGLESLFRLFVNRQKADDRIFGFVYINILVKEALENDETFRNILRSKYKCILIDEFQDINTLQFDTLKALNAHSVHFTYVGDDDQSIYYWRGADSSIIKNLSRDERVQTIYLLTNYRNNPNIVNAGNSILKHIKGRAKADKPIIAKRQTGSKIRISEYDTKFTNIVNEVERLIAQDCAPEDICILCRKNATKNAVADALLAANIAIDNDIDPIDKNDNYKLLKAIINILSNNEIVKSCREIKRISEDNSTKTDKYYFKIVIGHIDNISKEDDTVSYYQLSKIKKLADEIRLGYFENLADLVNNYSIKACELFEGKTNEEHSDPMFHSFELFCKNNNASWPINKETLSEIFKVYEEDNGKQQKSGIRAYSSGVRLASIHRAKGLEYKAVMIVGLNSGEYPDLKQIADEYQRNEWALNKLNEARDNYAELKESIVPKQIDIMLLECDNAIVANQTQQQLLKQLKKLLFQIRGNLIKLTADGIDDFLDLYNSFIYNIIKQFGQAISEREKIMLTLIAKGEAVHEEMLLLQNEKDAKQKENEYSLLIHDYEEEQKIINDIKRQLDSFKLSIKTIIAFYGICTKAKGLLLDISKSADIQALRIKLLHHKEARENEERRTFYVAVTRAKDYLYLFFAQNARMSEFISEIPDELKTKYLVQTKEEEKELKRIKSQLESICNQPEVDDIKQSEIVDNILSKECFQTYIQENLKAFYNEHPIFNKLTPNAKLYFDKAIGLLYLGDYTAIEFETEFAHNVQRAMEVYLLEIIGENARQYKTDIDTALSIAKRIREITKECITQLPGEKYITDIFTINNINAFAYLKSLGIMHFVIRSGYWTIPTDILGTWANLNMFINPEQFLIAIIDISNLRNTLIHVGEIKEGWNNDYIPTIINDAEKIVRSFNKNNILKVAKIDTEAKTHPEKEQKAIKEITDERLIVGMPVFLQSMGRGIVTFVNETAVGVTFANEQKYKVFSKQDYLASFIIYEDYKKQNDLIAGIQVIRNDGSFGIVRSVAYDKVIVEMNGFEGQKVYSISDYIRLFKKRFE